METQKVEAICKHLSVVTLQAIRKKILRVPPDVYTYGVGEALIFWVADWLTGLQIIATDQVRLLIEEFAGNIITFGKALEEALAQEQLSVGPPVPKSMRLPMCKIGFLDRWQACMDGRDTFLDLKTGEVVPAIDRRPLETIAYNLTALYIRYTDLMHIEDIRATNDTRVKERGQHD